MTTATLTAFAASLILVGLILRLSYLRHRSAAEHLARLERASVSLDGIIQDFRETDRDRDRRRLVECRACGQTFFEDEAACPRCGVTDRDLTPEEAQLEAMRREYDGAMARLAGDRRR